MRIMPIMNNQISYKGTLIFQNGVVTSCVEEKGRARKAKSASVDTKDINMILSAENYTDLSQISMKPYKTLIKMNNGDYLFVKPTADNVTAAKHESDGRRDCGGYPICHIFNGAKHEERTSTLEIE